MPVTAALLRTTLMAGLGDLADLTLGDDRLMHHRTCTVPKHTMPLTADALVDSRVLSSWCQPCRVRTAGVLARPQRVALRATQATMALMTNPAAKPTLAMRHELTPSWTRGGPSGLCCQPFAHLRGKRTPTNQVWHDTLGAMLHPVNHALLGTRTDSSSARTQVAFVEIPDLYNERSTGHLAPLATEHVRYPGVSIGLAGFPVTEDAARVLAGAPRVLLLPADRVDGASWTVLRHLLSRDGEPVDGWDWVRDAPHAAEVAWTATH